MPRASTKDNKTIYQQTREELGLTREKASELLEFISPERIERIESGRYTPKSDEILQMAEKYKAPELCNYYCAKQCEIGNKYVPEIQMKQLSQIVLEVVASVNTVREMQMRLIDISADGKIENDELRDFVNIQNELEQISVSVETLQLWTEKMIADGKINIEEYEKIKNEAK